MSYRKKSKLAVFITIILTSVLLCGATLAGAYTNSARSRDKATVESISNTNLNDQNILNQQQNNVDTSQMVIYDSVEIRYNNNGWPYLHDVITNKTSKSINQIEYYMLAYDQTGQPLKLHWHILDSSDDPSYDCLVTLKREIRAGRTYDDDSGGWSLYDEEKMEGWPKIGEGGPNKVSYALYSLKQITFSDGTIWNNPSIENWLETYKGKTVSLEDLQNYYPFSHLIEN